MKMKKIITIFVFILSICAFATTSYGAGELELELELDKKEVKVGDEISATVSITSDTYADAVAAISGIIEYDDQLLEPIITDTTELSSEQQLIVSMLIESEDMDFELLSAKEKWIIGIASSEDDPETKAIMIMSLDMSGTASAIEAGETKEIGEIGFKVLNTETAKTTTIKLSELEVEGEEGTTEIEDVATSQIKIEPKTGTLTGGGQQTTQQLKQQTIQPN